MKRPLLSLVVLVAAGSALSPSRANAQSLSFGLMAGASLSTFTGKLASDVKNYAGFIAGGFIHASLAGFAVEPGLYYTQKGSKSQGTDGTESTNRLNYIQVPLVIKIGIPFGKSTRIYVGGGPAIGINIGCHFSTTTAGATTDEDCSKNLGAGAIAKPATTELTAIGVAGFDFGHFSLGVRGDFAVNNTYTELLDQGAKPDLKTRTLSAIASIRF